MNPEILAEMKERGITRLCHFTPARNLQHIASGKTGILSTASLEASERGVFNPTDLARLDKRTTHICCSLEYPNAWYFEKARANERLFTDWVVLLISPSYLADENSLFSPRNAAANYGRHIAAGTAGFQSMFAETVVGTANTSYKRGPFHRDNCPTDQQAEVLIFDQILPQDIVGVAVASEAQARTERVRLRTNGVDPDQFRFVIAPQMFNKYVLSGVIARGVAAIEVDYAPPLTT